MIPPLDISLITKSSPKPVLRFAELIRSLLDGWSPSSRTINKVKESRKKNAACMDNTFTLYEQRRKSADNGEVDAVYFSSMCPKNSNWILYSVEYAIFCQHTPVGFCYIT